MAPRLSWPSTRPGQRVRGRALVAGAGLMLGMILPAGSMARSPDLVPAIVRWQSSEPASRVEAPLHVLTDTDRASVRAEWAPLYRDAAGNRYEWARQEYQWRAASPAGALGLSFRGERSLLRSAEPTGGVGNNGSGAPIAALITGWRHGALALAGALGVGPGGTAGYSLAGRLERGPGWRIEATWSHWPARAHYDARYTASQFAADGRWFDQRMQVELRGPTAVGDVRLRLEAHDDVAMGRVPGEAIEPELGVRSVRLAFAPSLFPGRTRLELEHAMGRSGFRARTAGTGFANAGGGMWNDIASVHTQFTRSGLAVGGWAGRWRSDLGGGLSVWPFAQFALLTGTRRYATSAARLDHVGLTLDRATRSGQWEAGLATLWVRPRFSYDSWQGDLFGLGRNDFTTGALRVERMWLAGVRLCAQRAWGGAVARLELVQWAPVAISRRASVGGGGEGAGGGGGGAGTSGTGGTWGGTVLRVALSTR